MLLSQLTKREEALLIDYIRLLAETEKINEQRDKVYRKLHNSLQARLLVEFAEKGKKPENIKFLSEEPVYNANLDIDQTLMIDFVVKDQYKKLKNDDAIITALKTKYAEIPELADLVHDKQKLKLNAEFYNRHKTAITEFVTTLLTPDETVLDETPKLIWDWTEPEIKKGTITKITGEHKVSEVLADIQPVYAMKVVVTDIKPKIDTDV